MDVCIARKPIFNKTMKVYGYDLFYGENTHNDGTDDVKAELLYDSFFVIGFEALTNETAALIRFSRALIDSDIPTQVPSDKIVVKVPEEDYRKQLTPDDCAKIKSRGFKLALDGFILDETNIDLLEIADIIMIDFSAASLEAQAAMIARFKGRVLFLANCIETREEYNRAVEIGYNLFEGRFFTKPSYINSKDIDSLDTSLFNLIQELNSPEPDYAVITEIIERDLGLSYKLLKFVNSAAMTSGYKIVSISRAVTYLGTRILRQFLTVLLVKNLQTNENAELVKLSLVRGKLMSLLASELGLNEAGSGFYLTGIFSMIDVILERDMKDIVRDLPLISTVKQALLGENNVIRRMLDFIINYEDGKWDDPEGAYPMNLISKNKMMSFYIDALKWANILD